MSGIDDRLIESVFQPLTERAGSLGSCFDLARVTLYTAFGATLAIPAHDLAASTTVAHRMIAAVGAITGYVAFQAVQQQIRRAERRTRAGTMNVDRITLQPFRMLWLAMMLAGVAGFVVAGSLDAGLNAVADVAWVATVYLMSCQPVPPGRMVREARFTPAFAGVRG